MTDLELVPGADAEPEKPAERGVDELVGMLDLETIDRDLFRGIPAPNTRNRAFGGLVAAQALMAAIASADEGFGVHSMHSYFLLPGDPQVPIVYDSQRIRDGRSFETRRVEARQFGRSIFYLTANFQRHEEGFDHQERMPEVPPPDKGLDMKAAIVDAGGPDSRSLAREWAAIEMSWLGNSSLGGLEPDEMRPSRNRLWVRVNDRLPDDPRIHLGAFTYASDISLLGAALGAHGVLPDQVQMASLDHTIWFHRPFRADEWWLYEQESPSASGGRGLSLGRVFTQDGVLAATVAQEGIIRPLRSKTAE